MWKKSVTIPVPKSNKLMIVESVFATDNSVVIVVAVVVVAVVVVADVVVAVVVVEGTFLIFKIYMYII